MGGEPEKTPPIFFTKPADAVVPPGGAAPYPQATSNFHHEIELVVAIGKAGKATATAPTPAPAARKPPAKKKTGPARRGTKG